MQRCYIGVDWADQAHALCVVDERGEQVWSTQVDETEEGLSELGQWLHTRRSEGVELWASIEKPEGRIVDFLLDHEVVVYPINPKALDRARDRFRMSGAKSDPFDARVLAEFLRTDHPHLHPLLPSSDQAQELKLLTRDHQRLVRHQTRMLNQLKVTLKEYHPRPLKVFKDLSTASALDFLKRYPRPEAVTRQEWQRIDGPAAGLPRCGSCSASPPFLSPPMWRGRNLAWCGLWSPNCGSWGRLWESIKRRSRIFSPPCRWLMWLAACRVAKAA